MKWLVERSPESLEPSVREGAPTAAGRRDFGLSEEEVIRYWCERSGVPYLGRADIGHDADNKVVPFGPLR